MKKNIWINLFFILLLLYSCKTTKNVVTLPNKNIQETSKQQLLKQISKSQSNYKTFAVKAKSEVKFGDIEQSLNLNIRIKTGEVIWISASYLGAIEVARVLITPDTIKIQNKLQAKLIQKPFSYIHQFTSEKVDFATLENIFVGRLSGFIINNNPTLQIDSNQYVLTGNADNLSYKSTLSSTFQLLESILNHVNKNQSVQLNYSQFIPWQNYFFPTQLSIKSKVENKQYDLNMIYEAPEINTMLEFPFNVPKRFSVVE